MNDDVNPLFEKLIWMTTEETAKYLRKSVGAIHTAVNRGQLRARKWRRRLFFKKSEIDLILANSKQLGDL